MKGSDDLDMKQIYRKIAKEHGVSVEQVKREMQDAIDYAYQNKPNDELTAFNQNRVPRKDEIPTVEEFIKYGANRINKTFK